uniref:Uncharacterized protein n=1 Tax=Burkholderia phage vB_BgluM-SURPRISE13 TaxID=3159457 RepID=A0AAU7PFC8_9VIRU
MATKAGRAKIEDVKKGAKLFYVNGFTMSEEIVKIFVTVPYAYEDDRDRPFGEFYEWFEGKVVVGRKHTDEVVSYHFADVGIDTSMNKAELNAIPVWPEAMNFIFITEWHARQFIQRLKRLYPDRIPGKYPDGSFEAKTQKERKDAEPVTPEPTWHSFPISRKTFATAS